MKTKIGRLLTRIGNDEVLLNRIGWVAFGLVMLGFATAYGVLAWALTHRGKQ